MPSDFLKTGANSTPYSAFESLLTPIGHLHIASNGSAITRISFEEDALLNCQSDALINSAIKTLKAYFEGKKITPDLPLAPDGSAFQQTVWQKLKEIPFGTTISYKELAEQCGGPTFTRAVAAANGANPIAILIPCHRVIGSNGGLTGYAGGLWRKKWLLGLESPSTQISLF